jgi:hypothetical protein
MKITTNQLKHVRATTLNVIPERQRCYTADTSAEGAGILPETTPMRASLLACNNALLLFILFTLLACVFVGAVGSSDHHNSDRSSIAGQQHSNHLRHRCDDKVAAAHTLFTAATFNAISHHCLRIRHKQTPETMVWGTSSGANDWATQHTLPGRIPFTSIRMGLNGGTWQPELSPWAIVLDDFRLNYNLLYPTPAPTPIPTPSPSLLQPSGCSFFVAPNAQPTGDGSLAKPWTLTAALTSHLPAGSTVCLRGGTYTGKFLSTVSGTSAAPVTFKSYPGEWAVLDGYVHSTLTAAINATQTTITVADATGLDPGDYLYVVDPGSLPPNEEQIKLGIKSGNTFANCVRGASGTTARSHAANATLTKGGSVLRIEGGDVIFRNLEVLNSDPSRTRADSNTQNGPHDKSSVLLYAPRVKLINLIIHDLENGILSNSASIDSTIYGCLIFNNGYESQSTPDRYLGHGLYLQNPSGYKLIRHSVIWNNFFFGAQLEAVTGDSVGMRVEGSVFFNNGSVRGDANIRSSHVLIGGQHGRSTDNVIKDSFFYTPPSAVSGIRMGYTANNGKGAIINNRIFGGSTGISASLWADLTVTGNQVYIDGRNPISNTRLADYYPLPGARVLWDNNAYRNTTGETGVFNNFNPDENISFELWRARTGFDANSIYMTTPPTGTDVNVIANEYEAGMGLVVIYNWDVRPTVTVNLSGLRLTEGQAYEIRNVQNFNATPLTGTYSSVSPVVIIPMDTKTWPRVAEPPIGWTSTSISSTLPRFGVFLVRPSLKR